MRALEELGLIGVLRLTPAVLILEELRLAGLENSPTRNPKTSMTPSGIFWAALGFVVAQRISELWLTWKHTGWMRAQGGREYGSEHYPWMVILHVGFLFSLVVEHSLKPLQLLPLFFIPVATAQILRYSAVWALGRYWNTRVWILPGVAPVRRGIYRFLPHPNYVGVVLEIFCIPALFGLWVTAVIFTVLNAWVLSVRIRVENNALRR